MSVGSDVWEPTLGVPQFEFISAWLWKLQLQAATFGDVKIHQGNPQSEVGMRRELA